MTAPLIPDSALAAGESNMRAAANLLGLPAISIPVGYDKQGLPIGLQLLGRPWGEATLLRVASIIEEKCMRSMKRPALYYDILNAK